ncbi:MAG: parallel beta-helix domain-containing protein [Candidatus Promineifilaceae bacterium]
MRKVFAWVSRIFLLLVSILSAAAAFAATQPIIRDPIILDEDSGTGSDAVQPSNSGLLREYPDLSGDTDAASAELGRQLFFDPILSGNNDKSCATCHHPDLSFSNRQATTVSRSNRNVPTLWNVGYTNALGWAGEDGSLELQALTPLTHPDEMDADLEQMLRELKVIPAYVELFDEAYGEDALSAENVTDALAAFQRTIVSNNSAFDKYANGEFEALTSSQRRGLELFRSGATRCFECHTAPTFAQDTFRIIGVDSNDLGRAGVTDDGIAGSFKVPTLRNIALTAPYMHDGSFETLEEVVQFYADGGGRQHGKENIDPFVAGFEMSKQEQIDLVAFLHGLTDESSLPDIPEVALSGLETVERRGNPDRSNVTRLASRSETGIRRWPNGPFEFRVRPGGSIQKVADQALPGDTIVVEYGIYHERIGLDTNNIVIRGEANAAGDYPILDGREKLSEAFIISGNDFEISGFEIRDYTDTALLVEGVIGVHIHDIKSFNTGTYGIYPTKSTDVLVERVEAMGVDDAAIYAGQCKNVIIRDSIAYDSVLGIELENTINGQAYNNHVYNNSLGILVVVLPQLSSKVSRDTRVFNNLIENNNLANFAKPNTAAELVPSGTGILSLAADEVEIFGNTIKNNKTTGIGVFNLTVAYEEAEIDVGPTPEDNYIWGNTYENNGYDPDKFVANMGIPVGDILWDSTGAGHSFDEYNFVSGFPKIFPRTGWSMQLRRVHHHFFRSLVALVE